ncbi:DUF5959 family protein [Streptomyces sp. NPDC052287]|uniref:DUF5959 family protein n=1 Tax=Streptomyces sp. NPDC052287 TaxID=3154950 RepID=UPI003436DA49
MAERSGPEAGATPRAELVTRPAEPRLVAADALCRGSSFVSGRLAMSLSPSDLENWSRALDLLAAGEDICWRDDDHSPEIRIQPYNEEHETAAVRVEDLGSSCVSVFLPMSLEEGWIDEQRRLLVLVRKEWPSEVLQSSPGVYEWRH